jgi:NADH-quinone oxidoreductase subunit G
MGFTMCMMPLESRRLEKTGYVNVEWSSLPAELNARLKKAGRLAAVLSPHLTVEEAYLLGIYMKSLDPNAVLALGPVPTEGADEKFKSGFVIHAEKCPNRRGVESVVSSLSGMLNWGDFLSRAESDAFGAVWVTGGYKTPWNDDAAVGSLANSKLLIVQDCFASPLWDRADYQLPSATFAEREGSYVNYQYWLQSFRWAVRPPQGVKADGQLYWQLLGRTGLYNAAGVLEEIGREIPSFAAVIGGVADVGVDLRVNQLA